MPWTDSGLVGNYLPSVDLIADPTIFDNSIVVAERDLYSRLLVFIGKATLDAWTLVANTPELVVSWCTEFAAAYYLSAHDSYHLQPEIADNPPAVIFDRVIKQVKSAKMRGMIIEDVAGGVVGVAGIRIAQPEERYLEDLPLEQGGFNDD